MNFLKQIESRLSFIQRYQYRWMFIIAICWTLLDVAYWTYDMQSHASHTYPLFPVKVVWLRIIVVFSMSCVMGYLLMFRLRQWFRDLPLLLNLFLKTCVLLIASLLMNFLLQIFYSIFIQGMSVFKGFESFYNRSGSWFWLLDHSMGWVVLFIFTQLLIESYEKYSPGVFWDILIGRYIKPKMQKRIVLFLDLKNSTPLAEKLDSTIYFSFIRDFIYYVSIALLEYDGRIYQYVGDEIVTSWLCKHRNAEKCINALKLSEKLIRRNHKYFLRRYGIIPEFKAGIHAGEVTVGEIGIIKKDIAISGDTMNTAARIRTACDELNYKCLASKEFIDGISKSHPAEALGPIDLKGKTDSVELFALKI